jgi:hypothetical protein
LTYFCFSSACLLSRFLPGDDPTTPSIDETDCYGKSQVTNGELGKAGNLCHVDCSNRGACDYTTGYCHCFAGYAGHNCGIRL